MRQRLPYVDLTAREFFVRSTAIESASASDISSIQPDRLIVSWVAAARRHEGKLKGVFIRHTK